MCEELGTCARDGGCVCEIGGVREEGVREYSGECGREGDVRLGVVVACVQKGVHAP